MSESVLLDMVAQKIQQRLSMDTFKAKKAILFNFDWSFEPYKNEPPLDVRFERCRSRTKYSPASRTRGPSQIQILLYIFR